MSPAIVIVPVMALIVIAAIALVALLVFPYRGRSVPEKIPGSQAADRALASLAEQLELGHHPDAEPVSSRSSRLSSSTAPRE